jgi:hypothetical protein
MAPGVNEVLPMASFLHAWRPDEVKVDFVRHFTRLSAAISIVIMAEVIQNEATAKIEALQTVIQRQSAKYFPTW